MAKRSGVNRDIKLMFLSFMGGYMLAKTGILDDPEMAKTILKAVLKEEDGRTKPEARTDRD